MILTTLLQDEEQRQRRNMLYLIAVYWRKHMEIKIHKLFEYGVERDETMLL